MQIARACVLAWGLVVCTFFILIKHHSHQYGKRSAYRTVFGRNRLISSAKLGFSPYGGSSNKLGYSHCGLE
jgi:hypothetical protein